MLINDSDLINELLNHLSSSRDFYSRASTEAESSKHAEIFKRMQSSHTFAIDYLSGLMAATQADKNPIHAFGSVLNKIYPDILFGLDQRFDKLLIEMAKNLEQDTFNLMSETVTGLNSRLFRDVLLDLYPSLNGQQAYKKLLDHAC